MQKNIQISDNSTVTAKIGDLIELRDGRRLTIQEFGKFGKIQAVGADGGIALVKPSDIIRIVEEIVETVEKAKDFWAWFKNSQVGGLVIGFVQKLFKKKNGN